MCRVKPTPASLATLFLLGAIFASTGFASIGQAADERPNILWVTSEDNGPELGCYGDEYANTPNIDALAERSLRYRRCWSNAPVCAPARTTLISGMYATSLGGHHMRSGVKLPDRIRLYPQLMREAGYYCTNNSKTDYNFAGANPGWHESSRNAHWRNRPNDETPFFAVFNYTVSHESRIRSRPHKLRHDPEQAPVPAYHPDTPEVRRDWAQYYDKLAEMDERVGGILEQLREDGLADSTIVFYYGDHGSGMPRSKRWPFNSGLHVPLIVHVPAKFRHLAPADYQAGAVSDRLVAFVDLAPTILSLAGAEPPESMQGVAFAGEHAGPPKKYLFGFRGRMDERIDMVRCCTDGRYVYMRHFYPDRPYLKHVAYMFQTPTTRVWKERFDAGKLNEAQAKFWQPKPVEELFDLKNDPDEVENLAGRPEHAGRVSEMRGVLRDWMVDTPDLGLLPEAEMHRRCGDLPPRQYGLSDDFPAERLADVAFAAMDVESKLGLDELSALGSSDDSGVRYWAVRGIDQRLRAGVEADQRATDLLVAARTDQSPSVCVAACDALLASGTKQQVGASIRRLVELANVNNTGHFAAAEALNVLDANLSRLPDEVIEQIVALPRQIEQPPHRAGGYVGRLLDHITESTR